MAKTGKKNPAFDPFNVPSSAFSALDDALGTLEDPPATAEKVTPKTPPTPSQSPSEAKIPLPKKEKEPRRKPKKEKPQAGGGEQGGKRPSLASRGKKMMRFITTREESSRYEKAAMRLSAELGMSLDFSKLTRALWEVYLLHEVDVVRNVPQGEEWSRPANEDAVGLAELDERLTDLLNEGLMIAARRSPKRRP